MLRDQAAREVRVKELVVAAWCEADRRLTEARDAVESARRDHAVVTALAVQVYGDAESLQALVGVPADISKIAVRSADSVAVAEALAELTERAARSGSSRRRGRESTTSPRAPARSSAVADRGGAAHGNEPQADRAWGSGAAPAI